MSRIEKDERYMHRALRLAERGRGRTSPNPAVGAVVVKRGRVVGEGWHRGPGLDHAEIAALERAGARARGATMYVNLEPCAHVGRTPPCVNALLASGIRRCVVAVRDPHRLVNGRGLRRLRAARVKVELGLCAEAARDALGGYWRTHTQGLPRVTWKVAATFDGRIADARGASKWITGAEARRYGHRLRAASDAVVVGANTARRDDPRLTARGMTNVRQPLRVVCDTNLSLPLRLRVFGRALAKGTVVACGRTASARRQVRLESRGVRVWRLPLAGPGVSATALARRLAAGGFHEVLIEGGAAIGTEWMRRGLIERVAMFTAPCVLGGEGLGWCGPLGRRTLPRALSGRVVQRRAFGPDTYQLFHLEG